jgi:hypothetical protein
MFLKVHQSLVCGVAEATLSDHCLTISILAPGVSGLVFINSQWFSSKIQVNHQVVVAPGARKIGPHCVKFT